MLAITSMFWLVAFVRVATTHGQGVKGGPLAILMISLGTWIPFVSTIYYFGRQWRFPTVSAFLVAVSVFSCFNLNDNHEVRTLAAEHGQHLPRSFRDAFEAWLEARADLGSYSEYPVVLVAAEGGGLRAAYFTSLVLAAIQDRCPAFAQHVFAISSVSGGSIGASVFTAEAAHRAQNIPNQLCSSEPRKINGPFQRIANEVLARDFLTPLFAAGLYTDVVQRFLFFSVGSFDRARALEIGFEDAWQRVTGNNQFAQDFNNLWPDFAHQATPALFLNTTRVETGERMVVSNLYPLDPRFNRVISFADLDSTRRIRLSTAATLSARFPIVTPVGGIAVRDSTYRYADGGYFDNSGVITLAEMLSVLRVGEPGGNPRLPPFRVIVIRIGFDVRQSKTPIRKKLDPSAQLRAGTTSEGFSELMSPVRTLLHTRGAREVNTVRRLRTGITTLQENGHHVQLVEFQLFEERVPLVLGWLLSNHARAEMSKQFGPPGTCRSKAEIENECSFGSLVRELAPGSQFQMPPSQ
jgi:predicted acylesterase/phospholipase RssA